jgi:dCMP deaminase
MNWYIAARKQGWARSVRDALEAAGETVIARWIDAPNFGAANQEDAERSLNAERCLEDCHAADAVVVISNPDLALGKGGKHFECGVIVGQNKPFHIIGEKENIFGWLPQANIHRELSDFIGYVRHTRDLSFGHPNRDTPIRLDKWDCRFMQLARQVAGWSKDPSTKTGAVFVSPDRSDIILGYNGFAKRMRDDKELYDNRAEKYSRIVHCEMNGLTLARRSVEGYTLFTWPFLSCDRCAVHMVQAGIKRVVAPKPSLDVASRWEEALTKTKRYYAEAGVEVVEYDLRTGEYVG